MSYWRDLEPDEQFIECLDRADCDRGGWAGLVEHGDASAKNNWSNTFADACAQMVAQRLRSHDLGSRLVVRPEAGGGAEPPTITYWERGDRKTKKVDVLVGDLIAGLQLAVSLKGVAFRDQTSLGFGKNFTGRLYELENETRRLHEYRPQALVVALYFVPLGAVNDKKTTTTASGFADLVTAVRRVTGRADAHRQDEWHRVDLGFVALYSPGVTERFFGGHRSPAKRKMFEFENVFSRGVIRFVDVTTDPPYRGRPLIENTLTLDGVVGRIADAHAGPSASRIAWGDSERDE